MTEEEQRKADVATLRQNTWDNGDQLVDYLILHDCHLREVARAGCRIVGWSPEAFVMAWLSGDRSMLDG